MFNVDTLNLTSTLKPRADNLIVLPLLKASSSFLIDTSENREQPERGLVLDVGPGGVGPETGRPVTVISQRGELVCFGRYAGMAWEIPGPKGPVKVLILRDAEVLLAASPETIEMVIHDDDPRKMHEAGLTCEHCASATGEEAVNRLRAIAGGKDPDAPAEAPAEPSAIEQERERLRAARAQDASEPASVAD